jgi:hypothetical protein
MDISKIIESLSKNGIIEWVDNLKNKIEELIFENKKKDQHIEDLEAEIRRLKNLPAKPKFKDPKDKTSNLEDKNTEKRKEVAKHPRSKKKDLKIDRTERCTVDKSKLDESYEYKGTRTVVIQNIIFKKDTIEFEIERYYSAKHNKYIEGTLPPGFTNGRFGPELKAFILMSYYHGNVTIKKICSLLKSIGVKISQKQINNEINDQKENLVSEMDAARIAGIQCAEFQQIDDTGAKLLNKNIVTIVTCNPFFTNLYTTDSKSRREAITALSRAEKPLFKINEHAIEMVFISQKSLKVQLLLEKYVGDKIYSEDEVDALLMSEDFQKFKPPTIREIKTAMLAGAFYEGLLGEKGNALVSDDAGQFNLLYDNHVLCWYHEMRHYKELSPVFKEHQQLLKDFFAEAKDMYSFFKSWIKNRTDEGREYLFKWFNEFFSTRTGYLLLDDRKKLTFKKMEKLLAPLWSSMKLPLHNNESERDLRGRVIKGKISLFNRTWKGAWAWDLYIGLKETCRKNGVSYYNFLVDRLTEKLEIPPLAEIIRIRARELSPQF